MRRTIIAVTTLVLLAVPVSPALAKDNPAAEAAASAVTAAAVVITTPAPGRFCARAERGDVVMSAQFGRLKCKADPRNSRYSRWYAV